MSNTSSRKRKPWEEYTSRHKRRKIQEFNNRLIGVKSDQNEATAIHVRNRDTGSLGLISADARVQVTTEIQPRSDDHIKKVLLVKDQFGISNEAYHEMSMLDEHLPRSCKIEKEIKQINDQWEMYLIPGDFTGAQ